MIFFCIILYLEWKSYQVIIKFHNFRVECVFQLYHSKEDSELQRRDGLSDS